MCFLICRSLRISFFLEFLKGTGKLLIKLLFGTFKVNLAIQISRLLRPHITSWICSLNADMATATAVSMHWLRQGQSGLGPALAWCQLKKAPRPLGGLYLLGTDLASWRPVGQTGVLSCQPGPAALLQERGTKVSLSDISIIVAVSSRGRG